MSAASSLHYLVLVMDGSGSLPPMYALGHMLQRDGHCVTSAGYSTQRDEVEGRGFPFLVLQRASDSYEYEHNDDTMRKWVDSVLVAEGHLGDVRDLLEAQHYDRIIVDFALTGFFAALQQLHAVDRTVAFGHTAVTAIEQLVDRFPLETINSVRTKANVPHVRSVFDIWEQGCSRLLMATIPELDPSSVKCPPRTEYIRPLFEPMAASGWQLPWPSGDSRPLIL